MGRQDSIQHPPDHPEVLSLIAGIDEFKGAGRALAPWHRSDCRHDGGWPRFRASLRLFKIAPGDFVMVTNRQRPQTASGALFMTLEDETGNTNVILWQAVREKFRRALLEGKLLIIKGTEEKITGGIDSSGRRLYHG